MRFVGPQFFGALPGKQFFKFGADRGFATAQPITERSNL